MHISDWIGAVGVGIILLAYVLQASKTLAGDHPLFFGLNLIGAALACIASVMIAYLPVVVLEAVWVLVSVWGLAKALGKQADR